MDSFLFQWSTRLDEQLARMSMNSDAPYSGGSGGPYSPSAGFRPQFPQSPVSPVSSGSPSFYTNSTGPPGAPGHSGPTSPGSDKTPSSQGAAMPDAVLNMAAKGPPEKKPWSYAPDVSTLKEMREKVRRK